MLVIKNAFDFVKLIKSVNSISTINVFNLIVLSDDIKIFIFKINFTR